MRLVGGGGTSRVPLTSVWISDPARLKYSESVNTWKNFGSRVAAGGARQQSVGDAGLGIELVGIGEREHVDRIEDVEVLQLVA